MADDEGGDGFDPDRGQYDSEEVDSEIEAELYAQLHYATDADFVEFMANDANTAPAPVRPQSTAETTAKRIRSSSDDMAANVVDVDEEEDSRVQQLGSSSNSSRKKQPRLRADSGESERSITYVGASDGGETDVEDGEVFSDNLEGYEFNKLHFPDRQQVHLSNVGSGEDSVVLSPAQSGYDTDMSSEDEAERTQHRPANRYYAPIEKNIVCYNCDEKGHFSRDCPSPRKQTACHLCGRIGHNRNKCEMQTCFNCSLIGHLSKDCKQSRGGRHLRCDRCFMWGHAERRCSDRWRQFHYREGDLYSGVAPRSQQYCYNCGRSGHLGYECGSEGIERHVQPLCPYVSQFDVVGEERQDRREGSGKSKSSSRHYEYGSSNSRRQSIPFEKTYRHDDRDEYHSRRRSEPSSHHTSHSRPHARDDQDDLKDAGSGSRRRTSEPHAKRKHDSHDEERDLREVIPPPQQYEQNPKKKPGLLSRLVGSVKQLVDQNWKNLKNPEEENTQPKKRKHEDAELEQPHSSSKKKQRARQDVERDVVVEDDPPKKKFFPKFHGGYRQK